MTRPTTRGHPCDADVAVEKLFEGYRHRASAPGIAPAEAALRACGYAPVHIASGGGSDGNAFEAAGFHCVNLANGTERAHQADERVSVAALEGTLDVVYALLDEVAGRVSHDDRGFERIASERVYESGGFIAVDRDRFRYADGEEAIRHIVRHPGAVAIVAVDDDAVVLTRQPRETIGDPDSLEIPAGKLDPGETPLQCGRRELAEEVGLAAEDWTPLTSFYPSVGMTDEIIHVYLAQGLSAAHAEAEENERIEIVRWPLADLESAIAATRDGKTLIGLLLLRDRLLAGA